MRVIAAVRHDVRFQFRHGFYYAYAVISVIYILLLHRLSGEAKPLTASFLLFSDPGMLGFFFIGGIVLLERGQQILDPLFVTPFRISEYVTAKLASLILLALASTGVIVFGTFGTDFSALPLLIGIMLTSSLFTLIGLSVAVRVKSINQYLFTSPVYMTILCLPLLEHVGLMETPWFWLFPTQGALILIHGAFVPLTVQEWLYSVLVLLVWNTAAVVWAGRSLYRHIVLQKGGRG
ncbi:hypothetical protein LOK74_15825 [Brevibacillus humidisoli]|uniref:fluoroquinolone export ABC transporter permease subunit n=1 Tax=Brevibacillus humidisoli TaxID=2895522 RepID=UPI001E5CC341|nr:hypothetical protein [Brevibacillus humidisoli]UFJ39518.1 hypothetical protein LOK74_15825 [Brevibacillus humidisoli]